MTFPLPITSARAFAYTFACTLFYAAPTLNYYTTHHYRFHRVRGSSMAPSLSPDYQSTRAADWILVQKNVRFATDYASEGGSGSESELRRGMVVSFFNPLTGSRAVKRIVALQGDVVKPLRRAGNTVLGLEKYQERDEITVPFGHVWVEGDQVDREKTLDSNDYGPLSVSLLEGVAVRVVWPWDRRRVISTDGDWEQRCRPRIRENKGADELPETWAMA